MTLHYYDTILLWHYSTILLFYYDTMTLLKFLMHFSAKSATWFCFLCNIPIDFEFGYA